MDFLQAIAPQLAALLRAAADYLDGDAEEVEELFEESDQAPLWVVNDRGGWEQVSA